MREPAAERHIDAVAYPDGGSPGDNGNSGGRQWTQTSAKATESSFLGRH